MKKSLFTILLAAAALASLTSCEDMMDTTTKAYVFDENHQLNSANDSLYSAMGILAQIQPLGERYVIFGELRGDLASVPAHANIVYQNINKFEPLGDAATAAEVLGAKRDYYSVINNCNIALARMDTTITEHGIGVMLPEYVAISTMRAWTYLQLGLIYGQASYYTEPVLDLETATSDFPCIGLDQLVDKLIAELEPYAGRHTPNYNTVDGMSSATFFIEPSLLLGDLYLYNGNYSAAAAMYYSVIKEHGYRVTAGYANTWTTSVRAESVISHNKTYTNEAVVQIPYASEAKSYHPNLVHLTYSTTPAFVPAKWFVDEMNTAQHYHIDRMGITNISGYLEGDLRGMLIDRTGLTTASAFGMPGQSNECLITKYYQNGTEYTGVSTPDDKLISQGAVLTRSVALYRIPQLYLRYAQAVNRAGKPSLAFAVLKYGLREEVLADETKVDPAELEDGAEWTNFNDRIFDNNCGTAMRGLGLGIAVENANYILPAEASAQEVTEWVEERILEELASETCFEGSRFFDLICISRHRANHPAYMAEKIARRADNPAQLKAKLSDLNNLWIK